MQTPEIFLEDISNYTPSMLLSFLGQNEDFVFLDGESKNNGARFGIMALDPFAKFSVHRNIQSFSLLGKKQLLTGCPFENLASKLEAYSFEEHFQGLPCLGAAIGYIAYEATKFCYPLKLSGTQYPEMAFAFYDRMVVFDYFENKSYWVQVEILPKEKRMIGFLKFLEKYTREINHLEISDLEPMVAKESFVKDVQAIQSFIKEGDVYQVNLAHSFEAKYRGSLLPICQSLRHHNKCPYSAYINFESLKILSVSPERFVKMDNHFIQSRPIKGTVARGNSPVEDIRQKNKLLESEKDQAELLMITDLMRHDLGSICELKSVTVPSLYDLETYDEVFHLVATIEGELKKDISHAMALKAIFPAGSITGAPKKRAVEIIEEVEKKARGLYTGSIGYLGFNHKSDFNVAIRTLFADENRLYCHAGAGITAKSDPESEWQETLDKVRGIRKVLENINNP